MSSILKIARGVDSPKGLVKSSTQLLDSNSAHQGNIETLRQSNLHESVSYFGANFFIEYHIPKQGGKSLC